MNRLFLLLSIIFICSSHGNLLQAQQVDSLQFFTDEAAIEMQLTTDIKALQNEKGQDVFQPATASLKFPDGTVIEEPIQVGLRGKFRRGYCRIPPIMMQFRNAGAARLSSLGKLKLVIPCGGAAADEELILKEFLVYKLYNQLTDLSLRVRLVKTTFNDSKGKFKSFTQYSFLMEDDGDMARRNGCKKRTHGQILTEATDRKTMTRVAVFEYMIGNTDWSVPNNHNIELVFSRENPALMPYAVPYDFDYCGLVDASYAVPADVIGTEKVTERVYRGFPRNMDEIQETLDLFRAKKENVIGVIRNFALLPDKVKNGMIRYLEEFFRIIENKNDVKSIFIDNARTS